MDPCIDELYSPQLYGYGSRSQLSSTSCPAEADSCSHWMSSDKLIACIPARHQTAAWKSNLITRQENQHFRILQSPGSLFPTALILMHSISVHFNMLWLRLLEDCYVPNCSLTFKIATCKILKVKTVKIITKIVNRMWSEQFWRVKDTEVSMLTCTFKSVRFQPPVTSSPANIPK